jgi:hypothetical protein
MIVVKITCKADWEEWLYRCPGCGEEKIITVGPLE